eukprot:jgi/Mesvir1/18346/Mv14245-RA.1
MLDRVWSLLSELVQVHQAPQPPLLARPSRSKDAAAILNRRGLLEATMAVQQDGAVARSQHAKKSWAASPPRFFMLPPDERREGFLTLFQRMSVQNSTACTPYLKSGAVMENFRVGLRAAANNVTDRLNELFPEMRIVFRPHPYPKHVDVEASRFARWDHPSHMQAPSLMPRRHCGRDDIEKAFCVVTMTSGVGTMTIIRGTPVVTYNPAALHSVGGLSNRAKEGGGGEAGGAGEPTPAHAAGEGGQAHGEPFGLGVLEARRQVSRTWVRCSTAGGPELLFDVVRVTHRDAQARETTRARANAPGIAAGKPEQSPWGEKTAHLGRVCEPKVDGRHGHFKGSQGGNHSVGRPRGQGHGYRPVGEEHDIRVRSVDTLESLVQRGGQAWEGSRLHHGSRSTKSVRVRRNNTSATGRVRASDRRCRQYELDGEDHVQLDEDHVRADHARGGLTLEVEAVFTVRAADRGKTPLSWGPWPRTPPGQRG